MHTECHKIALKLHKMATRRKTRKQLRDVFFDYDVNTTAKPAAIRYLSCPHEWPDVFSRSEPNLNIPLLCFHLV